MGSGAEILMDNMPRDDRWLSTPRRGVFRRTNQAFIACPDGALVCAWPLSFLMTSPWMARSASSAGISAVLDLDGLSFHPLGEQQLGV
jgi:hypothetical protein